jgi:hypothetical protein
MIVRKAIRTFFAIWKMLSFLFRTSIQGALPYAMGSQPVVRVLLVVHEQVLGGTQKHFRTKKNTKQCTHWETWID